MILTFKGYRPVLARIRSVQADPSRALPPILIVWAVRQTAKMVPYATCLTQALVVRMFFAMGGQESSIRIGVASDDNSGIAAHAWVIHDGLVVIGGADEDISRYKPIADL